MANSHFSLRNIAFGYSRFASHPLYRFGAIDAWQIALIAIILLTLCLWAFWARRQSSERLTGIYAPWAYSVSLIFALLLARLPAFLPGSMNPDESMLLAGAAKLRLDPVFWRSLDGTTSGPLNYYPLTFLSMLGLPLDYATARLLNVLCVGGAIAVVFFVSRLLTVDWAARLTALPPLAAAMSFRSPDFLHYSSECVSVLLIAVGTWQLLSIKLAKHSPWWRYALLGVTVAIIPLAKFQGAPLAAVLGVGSLVAIVLNPGARRWRLTGFFASGALSVYAFLLAFLGIFGLFPDFAQSYILNNFAYSDTGGAWSLQSFVTFCFGHSDLWWYQESILLYALFAALYLCWQWIRRPVVIPRPTFAGILIFSILLASVYAVYRPMHAFGHYLFFLFFPLALVGAVSFAACLSASPKAAGAHTLLFILLAIAAPAYFRGKQLKIESERWMVATPRNLVCPSCDVLRRFTKPGDKVAIWGWASENYVLTGTIPATRDLLTFRQILASPQQAYYRRRFMDDLSQNPPQAFVDAVGRGQFTFQDRAASAHELFPALRDFVTNNFDFADDVDGVRLYTRRDLVNRVPIPFRMKCGSGAFVGQDGKRWQQDAYFTGGSAYQFPSPPDGRLLPSFFLSERDCDADCRYLIPVANGSYLVRLYFAELRYSGPGERLFDVTLNHDSLALGFDIFNEAGGAAKPHVLEFQTTASEGVVDIHLIPRRREAQINAIEILPADPSKAHTFAVNEIAEQDAGPLIGGLNWANDPAWAINSHGKEVGELSRGEMWSSWGGDDGKIGRITSSPLHPRPPGCLIVPVAHGPDTANQSVALLGAPNGQAFGAIPLDPLIRRWQFFQLRYSPSTTGIPVRVAAVDWGSAWGQWLAVGQPRYCK
jgi:hypothetical protein